VSISESPDRHIALEGAVNFRDLGGYPTRDGRSIRWRTVFRADGLSQLSPRDHATVRTLGVATVIDLRTTAEVERGRFPVEEIPVGFHHLPFVEGLPDPREFEMLPGMLAAQYLDMIDEASGPIAQVLRIVALQRAHPLIVHCTAGKDRTGVLVAVLLGILGVPDDVIVEDYALSAAAMRALRDKLIERYPEGKEIIEKADEVFSADPSNMSGLLEHLHTRFGSIEDYARSIGLGTEVQSDLRGVLLN
jgi:protein tyrosine/serine phosphatase